MNSYSEGLYSANGLYNPSTELPEFPLQYQTYGLYSSANASYVPNTLQPQYDPTCVFACPTEDVRIVERYPYKEDPKKDKHKIKK